MSLNLKEWQKAIEYLAEERDLPAEKIKEALEEALASAYKKEYGNKQQKIRCEIDFEEGKIRFWQVKKVVREDEVVNDAQEKEDDKILFNPERHILLKEARKLDPNIKEGDELIIPLEEKTEFGRIAAQTARQVILQKIRETEKELLYEEFKEKEGGLVNGVCQRVEPQQVYFDLGKTQGILTKEEQVPGEFYRPGQRFKLYVLRVEQTPRGPKIFLSRAFPKLVSRLLELEVPEIASGQVEIKAIAREPGSRTKVAVLSHDKSVDPIGAVVGHRGTRIMAVISELGGEKIDVVLWSEDIEEFIKNALSPAKIMDVQLDREQGKALCIVAPGQLSVAIGKDGQNVRLASQLTGWNIEIQEFQPETAAEKQEENAQLTEKSNEDNQKEENQTG